MSGEMTNSIIYANKVVKKYLKYFFIEVSVGIVLDLIAVYAAISRIVIALDYISFILPALPLLVGLIDGANLGREIWWWINEGYVHYIASLPMKAKEFVFLRMVFALIYEYYPAMVPFYAAMLIVGIPVEKMVFVLISSSALFILMGGLGSLIASTIKDWFKIAAFTSLIEWGFFSLTPTLYSLDSLRRLSDPLYVMVAYNPMTWLVEWARRAQSPTDSLYVAPFLLISLLACYAICSVTVSVWRE